MTNTFAIVKISAPATDVDILRQSLALRSNGELTLQEYLENKAYHFASEFGPNCTFSIQSTGQEEIEE